MNNSKLINILQTFSSKEKRHCRDWITCPINNQRQDVCDLYDFLWDMELKEQYLTKQLAWATIYPKATYTDGKMRQIIHRLLNTVEGFLVHEQLQTKKSRAAILLAESLKERALFKELNQVLKNTQKNVQKEAIHNWDSLRLNYELETLHFNASEQAQRTSALNLQELSDALDIQYFADKLRKACLLYSRLVVFKMNYQPKMLAVVLEQVKELGYLKIPAIGLYYYCYLAFTEVQKADEHFQKMMDYLTKYAPQFPPQEIRELYLLAINYTIKKLNDNSRWHLEKAFELYKTGITEGYLLEQGSITPFTYNNMVSIGIQMEQYKWVANFLHEYKDKIGLEHRESIFQECLAKLYYAQKEYKKAQQLLVQIQVKDILRILSCKVMLLRIYYETGAFEALESLLDSLKMYLRRKDVVGYHKENYNNITKYMQKLIRVNPFDRQAKQKLKAEILETNILATKKWMLEQLEQL